MWNLFATFWSETVFSVSCCHKVCVFCGSCNVYRKLHIGQRRHSSTHSYSLVCYGSPWLASHSDCFTPSAHQTGVFALPQPAGISYEEINSCKLPMGMNPCFLVGRTDNILVTIMTELPACKRLYCVCLCPDIVLNSDLET